MAEALEPIQLHTRPALDLDDDEFFEFCQINRDYRIERTSEGDILIMTPEAGSSGRGSFRLAYHFEAWAETDGTGQFFGPSTGFILPNGAMRSPDIAWVKNDRLNKLSEEDWNKFLPLCPDFVLELLSPTDRLRMVQDKMEEYTANGARLGWLLDPMSKKVHVYILKSKVRILNNPGEIEGDPVLPGFRLDVRKIWSVIHRKS